MKKIIFASFICLILLTGCKDKGPSVKLNYTCNGVTKLIEINEKSVVKCDMMGVKYEMKVLSIDKNIIKITTNSPMAEVKNGTIDPNSTIKDFEIKKGTTNLAVPMEGLIQEVTFEWNEKEDKK